VKTSADGLAFIAKWEGCVLTAYYDVAHVLTIGVGHVITQADRDQRGWGEGTTITHDEAMALLAQDVGTAETAVNQLVSAPLSQHAFDALVDFCFNDGTGALAKSALLHLLNAGDTAGAAAEFPKWCHAVEGGKLVEDDGLLARRKAEAAMFLTPDTPSFDWTQSKDISPV
jgi:lysozyme